MTKPFNKKKPRSLIFATNKLPRLNIRYSNFEVIDEIELDARKLGLKKNGWVKLAIQEKLDRDCFKHIFEEERVRGEFEIRYIIRKLGGDKLSSEAKSKVSEYIQRVLSDDE